MIADDLTGGAKVAALLESVGVRCPLLTTPDALDLLGNDVRAVVIGRKLLAQPADAAVQDAILVAEGLLRRGVKQIYHKYSALFTSTEHGNIGPVAEALMQLTQAASVLFCPARPERNATVYQGRLFLGATMLHETPRRYDPVTPMTNSNLVEVLQSQSRVKVGLLALAKLREGTSACQRFIDEQAAAGVRFFIVDAIEGSDLTRIAKLAQHAPFVTGSDDLPQALSQHWSRHSTTDQPRQSLPSAPGYAALISGSCTPKSNRQLTQFEKSHPVLRVDLRRAAGQADYVNEIVEWAASRLAAGPVGIATTADAHAVQRAQNEWGRDGAASLAENTLREVARGLFNLGARKFMVAGGETSGSVLDALGAVRLDVAPHEDLFGGYCHCAGEDPMAFVLKAGATGDEDFYAVALAQLNAADRDTT